MDAGASSRTGGHARVAVVGLGAMGRRIAARLLASHPVTVWNRTAERSAELVRRGALAAASPAGAAAEADAVLTMVADPAALRAVSEGRDGIAAGLAAGATVIEMSTVGPAAVSALRDLLPDGSGLLDAPVLGSLSEAERGELAIFVGGDPALVDRWMPLLCVLGSPVAVGPAGAGAAAKLVANSTLFALLAALGEALALARRLGLSDDAAFAVLDQTPLAAQARRRRPAVEGAEPPLRFGLSLARKDAGLIVDAAAAAGIELPVAAAVRDRLAAAAEAGWGVRDYSTLVRWIADPGPG